MKTRIKESVSLSTDAATVRAKADSFRVAAHQIAKDISQGPSGKTYIELGKMMEDFDFVVSEYNRIRYSQIEKQRSERTVETKLRSKKVTRKRWTDAEKTFLTRNWGIMKPNEMSKKLGRSSGSIVQKAIYSGLPASYKKYAMARKNGEVQQEISIPVFQASE